MNTLELSPLPELKTPTDLATLKPVIVIDSREQTPLTFYRLPSLTGPLYSGDYSFQGAEMAFAVERKTIPDLIGCCMGDNRERFERELARLRGYSFSRLVVIGTRDQIAGHDYRSNIPQKSVIERVPQPSAIHYVYQST